MLYEYIVNNYKETEPIFVSDLPKDGASESALVQRLTNLCNRGLLCKYDKGIYYIPKKTKFDLSVGPSADVVARYKYVFDGKKVKGFYSGHTFANQIGLTTQVPIVVEIVSNNSSAKYREFNVGNRRFIVRKSTTEVNSDNVYVLQLLDLLKNIEFYIDDEDVNKIYIYQFIKEHNISKKDIDKYIRDYPLSVFKNYYEMEIENAFA